MSVFEQTLEEKNAESTSREIQDLLREIKDRATDLRLAINGGALSLLRQRLRDLRDNMPSDTPRTDAALHYEPTHQRENGLPVLLECVSAEFARKLERENARLREALSAEMAARVLGIHAP